MSCTSRYRQLAALFEQQTGVPAGYVPAIQRGYARQPAASLVVNGYEVMQALGLSRGGPLVGQAMRYLENLVDDDPALNNRAALLAALADWPGKGAI